mmetsp:Transcript_23485/g.20413  ORF Transcript_23485/g.20413 Transcript_23485/m.20413 type:complete len:156 (+) Transcript_23485:554-1021(+)|eukprot:CAMPEP_0114585004 /NCGR_PEP_ID=MMETSP0125-20121206/8653_1 /TAXON_ID=485358 ORGANISM="Aristerostoma sp., Strain ATCC 50986" /NCGR_SAMPLE_ID=MMETSP0125 /ASSEMBLY_ACC=CAM_ASM_000245 /LENGTH=155 /DNA_ID=CAMNT_0001779859 /DNA_START=548 /DNA_END=1015 /DNA_ORIENTATION=+
MKSSDNFSVSARTHESSDDDIESNPAFIKALLQYSKKYNHDWKKVSKELEKVVQKHITPIQVKTKAAKHIDHIKTSNVKANPTAITKTSSSNSNNCSTERAKFTSEDDKVILQKVNEIGLNWTKISTILGTKTPLMVKNRYYYLKKKEQSKKAEE